MGLNRIETSHIRYTRVLWILPTTIYGAKGVFERELFDQVNWHLVDQGER